MKKIRHPRIRTSFAIVLSRHSVGRITMLYLVLSLMLAAIFGCIFSLTRSDHPSFGAAFRLALASLWTTVDPLNVGRGAETISYYAAAASTTALSVILPLFLLGAFIFKLFRHDPIEWRQMVSVINYRGFGTSLHFRFYNGTIEELGDLRVEVFVRIRSAGQPNLVVNRRVRVAAADELVEGGYFGLNMPGVPITIAVPLNTSLSLEEVVHGGSLQVQDATSGLVHSSRVDFLVIVKGTSLRTGENFTSVKSYSAATHLEVGHYQDIEVDENRDPKEWEGWNNFEGTRDIFLFAYGYLVSVEGISGLLGYPLKPEDGPISARLNGWRRTWNVGSNKESHPERVLTTEDGREYAGTLAYLGLERSEGDYCNGAVIRVDNRDLVVLADSERLYDRQNVTDQVEWNGKPEHCLVLAPVPSNASRARLDAAADKRNVVVRQEYKAAVEDALDRLGPGQLNEYLDTTDRCPYPVIHLDSSLDSAVLPFERDQAV